jgi:hypothetical protein
MLFLFFPCLSLLFLFSSAAVRICMPCRSTYASGAALLSWRVLLRSRPPRRTGRPGSVAKEKLGQPHWKPACFETRSVSRTTVAFHCWAPLCPLTAFVGKESRVCKARLDGPVRHRAAGRGCGRRRRCCGVGCRRHLRRSDHGTAASAIATRVERGGVGVGAAAAR